MAVDVYSSPPTTRGRGLPCLSPLTGVVRESSANMLIEKSFREMQKLRGFGPSTSSGGGATLPRPSTGQVDQLTNAASRHLGQMDRTSGSPYQRVLTPQDQKELRSQVVSHLKQMAAAYQEAQAVAAANLNSAGSMERPGTGSGQDGTTDGHARGPLQHVPLSRPSTSLSVSDLQMTRPGSRAQSFSERRLSSPLVSSTWAGADHAWPSGAAEGPVRHGTPSRLSKPSAARLLRQSCPSTPLSPTKHADVWRNPSAGRPSIPGGVPDWEAINAGRTMSAPRSAIGTKAANVTGAVEDYQPTRGTMYAVFSEMDSFDSGKVTLSAFEDAAFAIGMRGDQARRFFDSLDPAGRGFITVKEWGARDKEQQVLNFTRLYKKQTRNSTGQHVQEAASLGMAIEMAMYKLSLKNSGRSINSRRLKEAFDFIDTNGNGNLDRDEIADAFSALGIAVPAKMVDKTLCMFDLNNSGSVDYDEFLRTLYPTLSKGAYNQLISTL